MEAKTVRAYKYMIGIQSSTFSGRLMSFYCKIFMRMPVNLIRKAIKEAREKTAANNPGQPDIKSMAKVMRTVISELASGINLCMD
jgi:hypothetical protein